MFWIAPIQMPIIPVRKSPKYFQVSESGPSGSAAGVDAGSHHGLLLLTALTITLTTRVVYDFGARRGWVLPSFDVGVAC